MMLAGNENPTLLTRLRNWLNRNAPETVNPPEQTTTAQVTKSTADKRDVHRNRWFDVSPHRRTLIHTTREMYTNDPRVEKLIQGSADDGAAGTLVVTGSDEEAVELAEQIIDLLELQERFGGFLRRAFIDGDVMVEIDVAGNGEETPFEIVGAYVHNDPFNFERNTDGRDVFEDPQRAFWYSRSATPMPENEAGDDAGGMWYPKFFIIHARWNHEEARRYGRPMFASARRQYRYTTSGELDVWIRRRTRSGVKYRHFIDGGAGDIEKYKQENKDALDDPEAAIADFFTNVPGSIDVIAGDGSNLENIGDIVHHMEGLGLMSPKPLGAVGYNQNVNRDILRDMLDAYGDEAQDMGQWYVDQIVTPIVMRHLLLNGKLPALFDLQIEAVYKRQVTAADIAAAAQAINALLLVGVPLTLEQITDIIHELTGLKIELDDQLVADDAAGAIARAADEADGDEDSTTEQWLINFISQHAPAASSSLIATD